MPVHIFQNPLHLHYLLACTFGGGGGHGCQCRLGRASSAPASACLASHPLSAPFLTPLFSYTLTHLCYLYFSHFYRSSLRSRTLVLAGVRALMIAALDHNARLPPASPHAFGLVCRFATLFNGARARAVPLLKLISLDFSSPRTTAARRVRSSARSSSSPNAARALCRAPPVVFIWCRALPHQHGCRRSLRVYVVQCGFTRAVSYQRCARARASRTRAFLYAAPRVPIYIGAWFAAYRATQRGKHIVRINLLTGIAPRAYQAHSG